MIGTKAYKFTAPAILDGTKIDQNFSLDQYLGKKEVIFFFYPKDFTFVCPTELLAFQARIAEFEKRNVAVVGCSTDTEETHLAWLNTAILNGGISGVKYPLVADTSKIIAANYKVLGGNWVVGENEELTFEGLPIAYRGLFLIDKGGIIRHQCVNDLPMGRSIEEVLRVVDMWQYISKYGEVCPANWKSGDLAMKPSPDGVREYMKESNK